MWPFKKKSVRPVLTEEEMLKLCELHDERIKNPNSWVCKYNYWKFIRLKFADTHLGWLARVEFKDSYPKIILTKPS